MDLTDHVGPGQDQHVAVAVERSLVIGEALAAKVGLAEAVALQHGAHATVEQDDALTQESVETGERRVGSGSRRSGHVGGFRANAVMTWK